MLKEAAFPSSNTNLDNQPAVEAIGLRESLKNQPETADLLFFEYARLADGTEQTAEEISRLYNEIFFEKQVDKNEVASAILKRATKLLVDAEEKLKTAPEEDKQALARELAEELIKEQLAQARMLEDFKELVVSLNNQVKEIDDAWKQANWQEVRAEAIKSMKREGFNKKEIEHDLAADDMDESEVMPEIKEYFEREKKFDSGKTKEVIEQLEGFYKKTIAGKSSILRVEDFAKTWGVSEDEARKILEEKRKGEEEKYKPHVDKLKALLILQETLEKKMDELIYGNINVKEAEEKSLPEAILNKYYELVEITAKNKKELLGLFKNKVDITEENLDNIMERVLVKAKECLDNFKELIMKGGEADEAEILKKLEKYQADIILFVETFKTLNREGKKLQLADFKNIDISQRSGQEIPEEEKKEFESIAAENWSKYYFKDEVIKEFKNSLESSANRFYTVKYGGKIIAFIRFDPQENCELYGGSLNVRPDLRNSAIGEAVLKTILKQEASGNIINAKAYSRLPILKRYIGEFGFVATEMIDNYHGREGEFGLKMLLVEEENKNYKFFNQSLKEIEKNYSGNVYAPNQLEIVLKFNSQSESKLMAEYCRKLFSQGYVLTAYRPEKEKTSMNQAGQVYLAFEKRVRRLEQAA